MPDLGQVSTIQGPAKGMLESQSAVAEAMARQTTSATTLNANGLRITDTMVAQPPQRIPNFYLAPD